MQYVTVVTASAVESIQWHCLCLGALTLAFTLQRHDGGGSVELLFVCVSTKHRARVRPPLPPPHLSLGGLCANLFVVLLHGREVLARLQELALLHALADVPVHKGALRVPAGRGGGVGDGGGPLLPVLPAALT